MPRGVVSAGGESLSPHLNDHLGYLIVTLVQYVISGIEDW